MDELQVLEHVAEICSTSATAAELCRKIVHSPRVGQEAVGAAVYLVTQAGDLDLLGSYGKYPKLDENISIWGESPIAKAAASQTAQVSKTVANDGNSYVMSAVPILNGNGPVGVICMLRTSEKYVLSKSLSPSSVNALAHTLGIWVNALGVRSTTGPVHTVGTNELTERQIEILRLMAMGQTNAQIAAEMILSESSIRQETVRIYRALGVGTRAEAARKGLNLGLIERVAI